MGGSAIDDIVLAITVIAQFDFKWSKTPDDSGLAPKDSILFTLKKEFGIIPIVIRQVSIIRLVGCLTEKFGHCLLLQNSMMFLNY